LASAEKSKAAPPTPHAKIEAVPMKSFLIIVISHTSQVGEAADLCFDNTFTADRVPLG
jgi:hypothetical protein